MPKMTRLTSKIKTCNRGGGVVAREGVIVASTRETTQRYGTWYKLSMEIIFRKGETFTLDLTQDAD